jgi:hypothetical protein
MFPMLWLVVMILPVNVIYDYGLLYLSYLRGVGTTILFLLELMYDILATMIMFVRLSVQNIRFFLMFFAFFELYEFVYMTSIYRENTYGFDSSFLSLKNFCEAPFATGFYTLISLPALFMK